MSIVNPSLIKNYALSLGKRNKTDKVDAEVIARFSQTNKPNLWEPPSEAVRNIAEIMRTVDGIKKQRQALNNKLEVSFSKGVKISLKRLIGSLDEQIAVLEEEARKIIDSDVEMKEKKDLLKSISGIGEQTATIILSETRGKPESYGSARSLVAYAGLCPSKKQSGSRMNRSSLSKKGSSYFRSKLWYPCLTGIRNNVLLKEFYERLLRNGKSKMQAICACMGKLLKIAYGVLKSGKPFDANYRNPAFSS